MKLFSYKGSKLGSWNVCVTLCFPQYRPNATRNVTESTFPGTSMAEDVWNMFWGRPTRKKAKIRSFEEVIFYFQVNFVVLTYDYKIYPEDTLFILWLISIINSILGH